MDQIVYADITEHNGIRLVKIKCPYCKKNHSHGAGKVSDPPVLGQRGSHCGLGNYILTTVRQKKFPDSA